MKCKYNIEFVCLLSLLLLFIVAVVVVVVCSLYLSLFFAKKLTNDVDVRPITSR